MPVLVMRCEDGPAHVPSRVVTCAECLSDCWLSRYSGESTIEAARRSGDGRVFCVRCLPAVLRREAGK